MLSVCVCVCVYVNTKSTFQSEDIFGARLQGSDLVPRLGLELGLGVLDQEEAEGLVRLCRSTCRHFVVLAPSPGRGNTPNTDILGL